MLDGRTYRKRDPGKHFAASKQIFPPRSLEVISLHLDLTQGPGNVEASTQSHNLCRVQAETGQTDTGRTRRADRRARTEPVLPPASGGRPSKQDERAAQQTSTSAGTSTSAPGTERERKKHSDEKHSLGTQAVGYTFTLELVLILTGMPRLGTVTVAMQDYAICKMHGSVTVGRMVTSISMASRRLHAWIRVQRGHVEIGSDHPVLVTGLQV